MNVHVKRGNSNLGIAQKVCQPKKLVLTFCNGVGEREMVRVGHTARGEQIVHFILGKRSGAQGVGSSGGNSHPLLKVCIACGAHTAHLFCLSLF